MLRTKSTTYGKCRQAGGREHRAGTARLTSRHHRKPLKPKVTFVTAEMIATRQTTNH